MKNFMNRKTDQYFQSTVITMRSSLEQTKNALVRLADFVRDLESKVNSFFSSQVEHNQRHQAMAEQLQVRITDQNNEISCLSNEVAAARRELSAQIAELTKGSTAVEPNEEILQETVDKYVRAKMAGYEKQLSEAQHQVRDLAEQLTEAETHITRLANHQKLLMRHLVNRVSENGNDGGKVSFKDAFELLTEKDMDEYLEDRFLNNCFKLESS